MAAPTRHIGAAANLLSLALFAASLWLGTGYSLNSLYTVPVLMTVWAPSARATFGVAALATVLLTLNAILVSQPVTLVALIFNRAISVLGCWLTALVVERYRRSDAMRVTELRGRLEAEHALQQSDRKLEDVQRALDQAAIVSTTDVQGTITYVNERFCEISGYRADDLLGQNHRIVNSGLHPLDFFRDMYTTVTGGRVWRGEIRNRAKNGSHFWVDTTIVPSLDAERRPYQFIAVRYDITERKQSEAKLRDQNALANLGKMSAVVAHEVRNPLAAIRGAIQMIGRRLAPGSAEQGIANEVIARVDSLNVIVHDLLLFAKPPQPMRSPIRLESVVEETVLLMRQDPTVRDVTIRTTPTDVVVSADAAQIKLVLLNLLMNGAEAMNGHGALTVSTASHNGHHELRIIDEGPGITPEVREHLFEPFFTTRHTGTGLGLVTARRILEAHGGSIELVCPTSGGTTAIIRLPAR